MDIDRILASLPRLGASDLHIQVNTPPIVRIHGNLANLDMPAVTAAEMESVVNRITDETTRRALETRLCADFAYVLPETGRFRVSLFGEHGRHAAAFRLIPIEVPPLETLNLPGVIREIAQIERGLVVVTGTTGSGKSTTLAAMINFLNDNRRSRVITIEDPIEYVHQSRQCLIAQREIGADAAGFLPALREALRQDPDVILVGELRDMETMRTALQAADTGHAVYSTVHTTTAPQTVQRLIAMFPPNERDLLLMQLATNLESVISQRLARTRDGKGRVPVVEVLRNTPVVRKMILEGKTTALSQAMANRDSGMQTFDQHLQDLYKAETISGTEALRHASNPEALNLLMRGITTRDTTAGLVRA